MPRHDPFHEGVLGLDIGGANLKAAAGPACVHARPFPLWKHPDRLAGELRAIRDRMPMHDRIAVTMTGELCDCFTSKGEGVRAILRAAQQAAGATPLRVWTTGGVFVTPEQALRDPLPAAAANWLALAHLAVGFAGGGSALLVDVGSTTTDVIYLGRTGPQPRGRTDRARLECGELVYTGLRRTPVCAVLGPGVAAEWFATMLDAYLVLGLVAEDPGDRETADGRPATRAAARARLARLWCADADDLTENEVEWLARRAVALQVNQVSTAVDKVLADRPAPRRVIVSGSGEIVGRQVHAAHPILRPLPVLSLSERLGPALSEAACAYAVARLATATAGLAV